MVFKRFFDNGLAHASFMVGCPGSGEAIVIDPNRNFDPYFQAAADEGLRIAYVAETHIHADFVSGARELAQRAGALLYVSDEGDADWKYAFAGEPNVRALKGGSRIEFGAVRLEAMHTPGHTPEHLVFVLTDLAASEAPCAVFTGDFVFVGDVGRPDLLENAAGLAGTAEPGARKLYQSLQRFRALPAHLLLWPSHGAGSACGKALGGSPVTTLGYELATNWAFQSVSEDAFVAEVLAGQPDAPPYFGRMKRLNKAGPAPVSETPSLNRVSQLDSQDFILDVRPEEEYERLHVRGSLHIPYGKSFTGYAGWLVPPDIRISLIAQNEVDARAAALSLSLIGIDRAVAWVGPEIIEQTGPARLASTRQITSRNLGREAAVLDVRSVGEWEEGHLEGAIHIPLGRLPDRLAELPKGRTIQVHCQTGTRSAIATSVLERAGFENVADIRDGFEGMAANGSLPMAAEEAVRV